MKNFVRYFMIALPHIIRRDGADLQLVKDIFRYKRWREMEIHNYL